MQNVIIIEHLAKSFGTLEVLKDISLTLKKGQNLAILGGSGSGKSVLIKCIAGLLEPDGGRIEVLGKDLADLNQNEIEQLQKKVGYLFQGGALYDSMTVRENLEFPVRRTKIAKHKKELNNMVEETLDNVGLLHTIDKMPSELSGGMKKRIGLARTLIQKPEIILYDEPTTGLDPVTSAEISELILKIQDKFKTSSIIVTHDMKCVKITANEIKLLKDGVFYKEGTYEELNKSKDQLIDAYFD